MKKFLSRSIAVFLLAFFSCSLCVPASASVYSSEYLNRYSGSITAQGGGEIKISFSVAGMKQLDELGASEIVVEKKVGSSWTEVKTYTNDDYPELSTTNAFYYSNYVFYQGVAGTEYRAKITIFGNTDYRTITTVSKRAT